MNALSGPVEARDFVAAMMASGRIHQTAGERLLAALEATAHPLDTVVTELGIMREEQLAEALAGFLGTDYVERPATMADRDMVFAIGAEFLANRAILPLSTESGSMMAVAMANPFDREAVALLAYKTDRPVEIRIATRSAIASWHSALSAETGDGGDGRLADFGNASESDLDRLRELAQQAPIVRFVGRIVQQAVEHKATDIHVEPFEHAVRIRMRVDGSLVTIDTVPVSLLTGIVTRIKILSGLDISERRLPQDGRMRMTVRGQDVDMRVSTIPAISGETVVLRLLDQSSVQLDLAALGYDTEARSVIEGIVRAPNGVVLVTGPTGSGKTTTLYALLSLLNSDDVKIITIEDPVEYRIPGLIQLPVNLAIDLGFATLLRSVLRQNPNIILVGEIRDRETAEIAVQAALTGHLVLSTLHTNSAVGTITRLREMGVEDFLIGATMRGVVAQRLLRKRCKCAGEPAQDCRICGGSGYAGRTVTFEIARISERIGREIGAGASEEAVLGRLHDEHFVPMDRHAAMLVETGVTTREEVARAVMRDGGEA